MAAARRDIPVPSLGVYRGDSRSSGPAHGPPIAALGLALSFVVCVALAVALAFGARSVIASRFTGGRGPIRSESAVSKPDPQTLLKQELRLVEQRRAALAAYAARVADFKIAMSRQPDALGLDAAEARRRDDTLTRLTLECINAVDEYNLGALAVAATQIQSAGLPEPVAWAVECAHVP